jgi:TRAP-type C4-dicarboxylate transport system substrate-binding protein
MKKTVWINLGVALILALSLLLAACAQEAPAPAPAPAPTPAPAPAPTPTPAPAPAPTKTYEWDFFSDRTPKDWPDRQVPKIFEDIENETNGALKITIFSKGEHPYEAADMLKVVQERSADIVECMSGYVGGVEPTLKIYGLPFIMPANPEEMFELYYATRDPILTPIFDRWNAVPLLVYFWPPQRFHADVEVTSWDSLQGKRLRGWSAETVEVINILNGLGQNIAWAEVPTALATGVVDGLITSTLSAYEQGMYDQVKVCTMFELSTSDEYFLVNKDALAELDPATRNAFLRVWEDWEPKMLEGNLVADWKSIPAAASEYGVKFVAPSSQFRSEVAKQAQERIWPTWAQQAGPEGQKALDIVLAAYEKMK